MTHHFLTNHLVIPIPDSWWLLGMALISKGGIIYAREGLAWRGRRWLLSGLGAIAAYGLFSLQLYITAGVLLPWLFPGLVIALYSLEIWQEEGL
jgi:hypothetical protein